MTEPERKRVTLDLELPEDELWALAQFLKRVGFQEWRLNATSEEEAYRMRAGCSAVQDALAEAGYAPR